MRLDQRRCTADRHQRPAQIVAHDAQDLAARGGAPLGGGVLRRLLADQIDDVIDGLIGVLPLFCQLVVGDVPFLVQLLPAGAHVVGNRGLHLLELLADDAIGHPALALEPPIDVVPLVRER